MITMTTTMMTTITIAMTMTMQPPVPVTVDDSSRNSAGTFATCTQDEFR